MILFSFEESAPGCTAGRGGTGKGGEEGHGVTGERERERERESGVRECRCIAATNLPTLLGRLREAGEGEGGKWEGGRGREGGREGDPSSREKERGEKEKGKEEEKKKDGRGGRGGKYTQSIRS
jgi:hypothetical protein